MIKALVVTLCILLRQEMKKVKHKNENLIQKVKSLKERNIEDVI
jgi:hypothetical protein